jgi:hypothetical protein
MLGGCESGRSLIFGHYTAICLDPQRKTTENISQDDWYSGRDLNQAHPRYKCRLLRIPLNLIYLYTRDSQ